MMNADHFAAATFRKASGSGDAGCVEVAVTKAAIGIRDSKQPAGGVLGFATPEWRIFLTGVMSTVRDLND